MASKEVDLLSRGNRPTWRGGILGVGRRCRWCGEHCNHRGWQKPHFPYHAVTRVSQSTAPLHCHLTQSLSTTPSKPVPPDPKYPSLSMPHNPSPPVSPSPQTNEPTPRYRGEILGELFIPYSKGRAWLKERHGIDLPDDHSGDLTIVVYLQRDLLDHGYGNRIASVRPGDGTVYNLMIVTQWFKGEFLNTGPEDVEEILQDDLEHFLKPRKKDEQARTVLLQELGKWTYDCVSCNS